MKKNQIIIYPLILVLGFLLGTNMIGEIDNVKGDNANTLTNAITGSIQIYSGTSVPTGYLECNGQAVSRTTYSELYKVIGTKYGSGDGSTTFNLPNLSGRIAIGSNSSYTIGSKGGEYTHELKIAEMPSHTHTFKGTEVTSGSTMTGLTAKGTFTGKATTSTSSGSHSHGISAGTKGDFTVGNTFGSGVSGIPLGKTCYDNYNLHSSYGDWFSSVYYAAAGGAHTHTVTAAGEIAVTDQHKHNAGKTSGKNTNTGSGSKHNNIQPYSTIMYVIKY